MSHNNPLLPKTHTHTHNATLQHIVSHDVAKKKHARSSRCYVYTLVCAEPNKMKNDCANYMRRRSSWQQKYTNNYQAKIFSTLGIFLIKKYAVRLLHIYFKGHLNFSDREIKPYFEIKITII